MVAFADQIALIAASVLQGDPDAAELHTRQHIHRARRYMALDDNQEST
jgi:DNA-binding GntR family transcriptional regulator